MYQGEIFPTPEANVSIMDFLGDDGTDINPEVKPVYEEHVAFSVHGLGRMGAETPINSPQRRSRTFSYGDFSPSKVDDLDFFLDHINTSNEHDHKYKEDPSMPYANFACRMTPGSFSFSEDVWDPFSIPVQETSRIFDNVKYNMDDSRQNLSFGCKSPCCTGTPARKFSSEIDCSYIMLDDPNDSLSSKSFGSEESCSSTAERGQMSSSSTLNADMRKPLNKYTSATWLRSNIPKSRDHEKISFPVKPKRSLDSDMQSNKLFDVNDPLLERPHEDSEFSSFHVTTKRKTTPTVCGRSVAQSLSANPEADFFTEDQRPFDQPEHYLDPVRDISVKGRSCGDVQYETNLQLKQFQGFYLKNGACKENDYLSSRDERPGDDHNCIDVINQVTDEMYSSDEKRESSSSLWL
ncbi:hypothetical protein SAY86_009693 [Trapa natans]|uniref:Uncharacterized protein n=1 Tax=Trapa natans TaxID=22666 RepID=A0AAN7L256_TRANT|nr:hypothetical protein SAY86_009693 [Trapa natans]